MASIINASTTSTSGLVQTADASGVLQLQSNGTTGLTVGTGGVVTAANGIVMSSMTLGTATTGEFEYDGRVPYFTPLGTQRGVVPGMQYFALNGPLTGSNTTSVQSIYGVGVTLSSSTQYAFEAYFGMIRTAGTTNHNLNISFGGTSTIGSINYFFTRSSSATSFVDTTAYQQLGGFIQTASATTIMAGIQTAAIYNTVQFKGVVSVAIGGTFIPQYTLSAAPGGAYTTAAGSYILIYPIGAAGGNVSVGSWA